MSNNNRAKFITLSNLHITNLNKTLKNIKSDFIADFFREDQHGIIIITNKIVLTLELQTIEKYMKNINNMDTNNISTLHFPQSKSYLKIISIPYLIEDTNTSINSSIIKTILKEMYFFNSISLTSKPRVIKVSPKSDIAVVWINIWNSQSSISAKVLINYYFNIESHIATVYSANINSGVS